jgi:hypothetical protein
MLTIAAVAALTLASGGAAMAQTFAPPPPVAEAGPPPPPPGPASRFYLAPGYYTWTGGQYVWVPRHWIPIRVGARWVPPHWGVGPLGRWHFIPGHWAR